MKKNSKKLELIIKKNLNLKGKISFEKIKKFKVGEEIDSLKFITIIYIGILVSNVLTIVVAHLQVARRQSYMSIVCSALHRFFLHFFAFEWSLPNK